jgi:Zn-dependent protease
VPLSPQEVLFRAAVGWMAGFALMVGMRAYLAGKPGTNGPRLWIAAALAIFGMVLCLTAAALGGGAIAALMRAGPPFGFVKRLMAIFGMLWATSIAMQVGQNICYRAVGARTYPIKWIDWRWSSRRLVPKKRR